MIQRTVVTLIVPLGFLASGASAQMMLESLIESIRVSCEALDTFEADFEVAWLDSGKPFRRGAWAYERGKAYSRCTEYARSPSTGEELHWEVVYAYDGDTLYSLRFTEDEPPSGAMGPLGIQLSGVPSPMTLLGWGVKGDGTPTLYDLIRDNGSLRILPEDTKIGDGDLLGIEFLVDSPLASGRTVPDLVRMWLDVEKDCRPIRIERYCDLVGERLGYTIEDIVLQKVDGLWLPVSGSRNVYESDAVPKEGHTLEEIAKLPLERAHSLLRFMSRRSKQGHKRITVNQWRIVDDIDDTIFTLSVQSP